MEIIKIHETYNSMKTRMNSEYQNKINSLLSDNYINMEHHSVTIVKNLKGFGLISSIQFNIKITGQVNIRDRNTEPVFEKRIGEPNSETCLHLNLLNYGTNSPEHFTKIEYIEPFAKKYKAALLYIGGIFKEEVTIHWED